MAHGLLLRHPGDRVAERFPRQVDEPDGKDLALVVEPSAVIGPRPPNPNPLSGYQAATKSS